MIPRRTIHLPSGSLSELLAAAFEPEHTQSARVAAFEDAFTRHAGTGYAIPVGSGRLGLRLILTHLGIRAGAEVILPAFTDESVPSAVRALGASPVFVDVDRDTMNMTAEAVRAAISPRTRAVIATHLFGNPCDLDGLAAASAESGASLIEDCAHAIDARWQGRLCGTFGRAAIFSFVVTKAVNTFGGGLVLTGDNDLALAVRNATGALPLPDPKALLKRITAGIVLNRVTSQALFSALGGPALKALEATRTDVVEAYNRVARPSTVNADIDTAFSPLQAAVGLPQLRALPETQARRVKAAEQLRAAMPATLRPQRVLPGASHAYYFLVATAEDPGAVARALLQRGVDVGRRPMRNVSGDPSAFPNAEYLEHHALQIPIHPELTPVEVDRIADALGSGIK